ncbi:MAG: aminoacyl-tRNA hydrolase [Alphaproteobacteria bacterium]|nr:aminoacyl-tRNA hydrolase [Alphaproteobacteria bacterium]MCB9696523.1 aminoacyl-tRNA hydrolase [Alphaproteobacteria bacterium]
MHLVIGLGNPGRRYERTRHNAGFLVVDRLAERVGGRVERKQLGALVDSVRVPEVDDQVVLAKPQGFMNLSGQPAASLRGYYKVRTEDIVVVHDDVDLPFGDVRVKKGGGHGGHNGLRDLQEKLGGGGFVRVRFGVGRPPPGWDTADYVLANFTSDEEARLPELVDEAADTVVLVARLGVDRAMNQVNARPRPAPATGPQAGKAS